MSWDDVNGILYEGSKEEIAATVCPECGQSINYRYVPEAKSFTIYCAACGTLVRAHGGAQPNCAVYFGLENKLPVV